MGSEDSTSSVDPETETDGGHTALAGVGLPEELRPTQLVDWEVQPLPTAPIANGPLVVSSDGAWTVFDRDLNALWDEQIVAPSDDDHFEVWGFGRAYALPWPSTALWFDGNELQILNVSTRERLATGYGYLSGPDLQRVPPNPTLVFDAEQSDGPGTEIHSVVDLAELATHPLSEQPVRSSRPPASGDGSLVAIDGRSDSSERGRVLLVAASDPAIVPWEYLAPEGVKFTDTGSFDLQGNLVIAARPDTSLDFADVVEYVGRPGDSLQRVDAREVWGGRYPGLPIDFEDGQVIVPVADGTVVPLTGASPATPICKATRWNAAVAAHAVYFFDEDYATVRVEQLPTVGYDRIVVGETEWLAEWGAFSFEVVGAIDCVTQKVWNTAELNAVFDLGQLESIDYRYQATENGSAVAILHGEADLLLAEVDGSYIPFFSAVDIFDAATSPDGRWVAVTYVEDGQSKLSIWPLDLAPETTTASLGKLESTEEQTTIVLPAPSVVSWLLG